MKNLVIVMAGDNSLHGDYVINRDFELWTIYYGNSEEKFDHYKSFSDRAWRRKGLKIELTRRVLLEELHFGGNFKFEAYDFIFLPDDDIQFPNGTSDISRLFQICKTLQVDVFQPAVSNEFFSPCWESTRLIADKSCHRTNIVEVMMFGFSGKAFVNAYLAAIHAMQFVKSGWGIEPIWTKIGEAVFQRPLRTFVIDAVPAVHTRPIGSGSKKIHKLGLAEAYLIPQIEVNRMMTICSFTTIEEGLSEEMEKVPPSVDIPIAAHRNIARNLARSLKQLMNGLLPL